MLAVLVYSIQYLTYIIIFKHRDMTTNTPDSSLQPALDALHAALGSAFFPPGSVPTRNRNDYSGLAPTDPLAVARPADTAGVAATLRICNEHGVAVVPQGGLTGLCGGARAGSREVALSLERLVGIEEIDPASATMTVWAGTPLETIQQAAAEAGFFCPLDLGARGSCAIGGNLSTNAGGNRVIRYGMAREMVLGLEVVLADGTVMTSLNKMIKNNAGFDLKHLFIGSEGTLGVITRIVLRLFPKPASTMVAMCAAKDYSTVLQILGAARNGLGPTLSAFEVMWPDYWETAVNKIGVRNPFAGDKEPYGAYVLVEALGTDPAVDGPRFEAWLEQLLESGTVPNAVVAQSVADQKALWGVRDACGEFHQIWPGHLAFDIGLPVSAMDEYARRCKAEFRGPPLAHRQVEHEDLGIVQVVVELGIRLLNGQRRVRAVSQQRGNDLGEVGTLDCQALRSKDPGSREGG